MQTARVTRFNERVRRRSTRFVESLRKEHVGGLQTCYNLVLRVVVHTSFGSIVQTMIAVHVKA
jgi:hypothetical protein